MATCAYVAVTNIPNDYHASDLRAHFSALVETRSFICFHFRHRPEKQPSPSESHELNSTHSLNRTQNVKRCCIVKVLSTKLRQLLKHNGNNWTNAVGDTSEGICNVTSITLTKCRSLSSKDTIESETSADEIETIDEDKLLQMPEMNPPDKMPNGNVGTPTLVFLDMIQNCLLPHNLIKKLQLKFPKSQGRRLYSNVEFDYCTPDLCDSITEKEQKSLSDNEYYKSISKQSATELSQESHTEHSKKPLKCHTVSTREDNLIFHGKSAIKLSQGSCESRASPGNTCAYSHTNQDVATFCEPSSSAMSIHDIKETKETKNTSFKQPSKDAFSSISAHERKRRQKADRQETRRLMAEGIEERLIAIERRYHNDEDAEEWDRHEASEDDPSNQERNKERLYETEEETPWEKGGPGVVFYTDASFWQAREGDFDEQTTDDLDVDFSAYEEAGAGDKDIKDFLRIRQEERFRSGYDKTDRFSIGIAKPLKTSVCKKLPSTSKAPNFDEEMKNRGARHSQNQQQSKIGHFEKFSKGVGRRVMERQGWQEGQGLGSSQPGIVTALTAHGQGPRNKCGLGYKQPSDLASRPLGLALKRRQEPHLISTVYDNPKESDPKVPLLMREEPTTLKHRQAVMEDFSSPS